MSPQVSMIPTQHIGIRLEQDALNQLQKIGKDQNQTANQIAKIAILEWLEHQWTRDADFITIPKKNFAFMLELMNPDQRKDYLHKIAFTIIKYFEFHLHKPLAKLDLETYIESMIRFIGKRGMRWFKKIDYQAKTAQGYFSGTHDMGTTWSEIFVELNQILITQGGFNFSISAETQLITESTVYIEFTL